MTPPLPPPAARRYTVAVRALCEFAAKQGDLDLRFTPSPTASQGIAGHQRVAASRPAGWRAELPLSGEHRHLTVRGRADGYDPVAQRLEEVKTFKGELAALPANHRALHWAQARVYGHLLCQQLGLPGLTLALVYYDIQRQQEAPALVEQRSAAELAQGFAALCERFMDWADRELDQRAQRDAGLLALGFPHAGWRDGQRALAAAVYQAARAGRCLAAQAPTGIGKTLATLFPLLKACPGQAIDKVFFLSAKTPGRALALDALATLRAGQPALRVVELLARDTACVHPDRHCHGDSCPLARGFYDRLPAARDAAVTALADGAPALTGALLRAVGQAHQVCPYYLGQELVRWCDVVVGDYNQFFDSHALLHGLTQALGWRVVVLVDEAHNLVERGRAMYSATLAPAPFQALRAAAPPALRLPLDRLHRQWRSLARAQTAPYQCHDAPPPALASALQAATAAIGDWLLGEPGAAGQDRAAELPSGQQSDLLAEPADPADLLPSAHLSAQPPAQPSAQPSAQSPAPSPGAELMRGYFALLQFSRLLDSFGPHSVFDSTLAPADGRGGRRAPQATLCLRNLVPAPFLAPRLAAARSVVLFSATLSPLDFYADTLGLPADTAWIDVAAPFRAEQLQVRIVRSVSTRWADRARSLAPIADLIAGRYAACPGNYLAFFSSFDYLQQAADAFAARHPAVPVWRQGQRMAEAERAEFLARFRPDGRGIGFAVLGGSFAEGIDLAGSRLIGAFIATLGLPQFNPVNEALRRRLEAEFGAGYAYAYLYPGIRKVVQAAGRVIRTLSDRGSLHLIDDRFARPEVLRLLPAWWRIDATPG